MSVSKCFGDDFLIQRQEHTERDRVVLQPRFFIKIFLIFFKNVEKVTFVSFETLLSYISYVFCEILLEKIRQLAESVLFELFTLVFVAAERKRERKAWNITAVESIDIKEQSVSYDKYTYTPFYINTVSICSWRGSL